MERKRANIVKYTIVLGIIVTIGAYAAGMTLSNAYFRGVAVGSAIMWVTELIAYLVSKD